MKSLLLLADENISLLESLAKDTLVVVDKIKKKHQEELSPHLEYLAQVNEEIASYEFTRDKYIAELHKAIKLKLTAIILERLTRSLIDECPDRVVYIDAIDKEHFGYSISYDSVGYRLNVSFWYRGVIQMLLCHGFNAFNPTNYSGVDLKHRLIRDNIWSEFPFDTDSLLALCSLLDINC